MFRRPIFTEPTNVVKYAKAAIALHNYLRMEESTIYCPLGYVDDEDGSGNLIHGSWRNEPTSGLAPVSVVSGNRYVYTLHSHYYAHMYYICIVLYCRYSRSAADIRDQFAEYFSSPAGEFSWQYSYIRRT